MGSNHIFTVLLGVVLAYVAFTDFAESADQQGSLVVIGGVLRYDHEAVWKQVVKLAGDDAGHIVVLPVANARAKIHGEFAVRGLERYGASIELLPISIAASDFELDYRKATADPELIGKIRGASGVFFVGGAPQRIAQVLYDNQESGNAIVDAIQEVFRKGGVVAGIDAGSAMLSTGIDSLTALQNGRIAERDIHPGLGLIRRGWLVDQHFLSHGRFAECLVAMRQLGFEYALGAGANTAVVITNGNTAEIIGDNGVIIVDLSRARADHTVSAFNLKGARLSYLDHGDRFDLKTLTATPHASKEEGFKVDPNAADHQPSIDEKLFLSRVLAPGSLQSLMFATIDGAHREAVGVAFRDDAKRGDPGFEFRTYSGPASVGWLSMRSRYTVLNVYLDVAPITKREVLETTTRSVGE